MNDKKPDEISVKDFLKRIHSSLSYIKTRWLLIMIVSILGGVIGLIYAVVKEPLYTASSTFVLDEGNKGGGALSQYAGLASMAGIDLGGSSNGGLFQSDNILELYKSRKMIEKTLLSQSVFRGKKQLLIERYIEFNNLRKRWREKDHIDNVSFVPDPDGFNRTQDSIISAIVKIFNKHVLTVTKPDKKTSIIRVDVVCNDELFAREFNIILVNMVNDFYSQTKTKKSDQNIRLLQHQSDSIKAILNTSINGVASAIDASPNANPAMQILKAPSQRKQVDVQASTAIYSEIVKNLELSKMTLRQETPLIQLIDNPVLPLPVTQSSKPFGFFISFFLFFFFTVLFLVLKRVYRKIMDS